MRRMAALWVSIGVGVSSAPTASATPLNLAFGDFVNSMAFDAIYQTRGPVGGPPNGATYDTATGGLDIDTRITSVTVDPAVVAPSGRQRSSALDPIREGGPIASARVRARGRDHRGPGLAALAVGRRRRGL